MRTKIIITLSALIFLLASFCPVYADPVFWEGSVSSSWDVGDNWFPAKPIEGDDVAIEDNSYVTSVDYDDAAPALSSLRIDAGLTLEDTHGYSFTVGSETVGDLDFGTFNQDGGTNSVDNNLVLGNSGTGNGTYNLDSGDLLVGGWGIIGNQGVGTVDQNGGNFELTGGSADLYLGFYADGYGVYNLYDGTLDTGWQYVGFQGEGVFNQYGGLNTQLNAFNPPGHEFNVGTADGSVGTYNLVDGELDAVSAYIGHLSGSKGTFNQTGGTANVNGGYVIWEDPWDPNWKQYAGLVLGKEEGSSGVYTLYEGKLDVANATLAGGQGHGEFNLGYEDEGEYFGEGIHETGDLYVGYDTGSDKAVYNLFAGTLNVVGGNGLMGFTVIGGKDYGPVGTGEFNQYGGAHNTGGLFLADTAGSLAIYNLYAGTLNSAWGTVINPEGIFNQSGGRIYSGPITNNGQFNVFNGGTERDPILINAEITNNNGFSVHNAYVNFNGTFTNNANFTSDPAVMTFSDFIIGTNGVVKAGLDEFHVNGNFSNSSTKNTEWFTRNAQLFFSDGEHTVTFNSKDFGLPALESQYDNNFAWGTVDFGGGTFTLAKIGDGSFNALYTGTIGGISVNGDILENFTGDTNIYYLTGSNSWLGGNTYNFASGSGQLRPAGVVPEPVSFLLFATGGLVLLTARKRRKA